MTRRFTTIKEAREWLRTEARGKGARCPCCQQFVKIYKWGFLSRMAVCLFDLWRHDQDYPREYIHITDLQETSRYPDLYQSGAKTMGYRWGLIESPPAEAGADSKCGGYWRITEKGRRFVRGEIEIPRYVFVYNNKVLRFEGEMITFKMACGKHSYSEMMKPAGS